MTDMTSALGVETAARRGTGRRLAIILSLLLILGSAGAALFLVRTVDSQLVDITNTYDVRRQARELILALVDAETGQRGFLLTQDRAYLEPYQKAIASMDATYEKLREMVKTNPGQRLAVDGLAENIEAKRSEMATTITLAAGGKLLDAIAITRSDAGRALMDSLRQAIATFTAEEDAKLIERNGQMDGYRQWLVVSIIAALAAAAILSYALFTRSQQQVVALSRQQNVLLTQNEELEAHVRARTAEAEEARAHAERERERVEALLQDTNHRIGNSLATVSSLLGLQLTRTRSDEVRVALEAAQSRVHAIASGHRRLRLGADLETTDAADFLAAVVEDLQTTLPSGKTVNFHQDFAPMVIPARDATTIGIVLGELVTNALKHAFPDGRPGQLWTRFGANAEGVPVLTVEDDGQGMDEDAKAESGLGALIIRQLARQFGGEPSYAPRAGGGTIAAVTLPELVNPKSMH